MHKGCCNENGELIYIGSPQHLKDRFGSEYKLDCAILSGNDYPYQLKAVDYLLGMGKTFQDETVDDPCWPWDFNILHFKFD